jgi:hypothetical protein
MNQKMMKGFGLENEKVYSLTENPKAQKTPQGKSVI